MRCESAKRNEEVSQGESSPSCEARRHAQSASAAASTARRIVVFILAGEEQFEEGLGDFCGRWVTAFRARPPSSRPQGFAKRSSSLHAGVSADRVRFGCCYKSGRSDPDWLVGGSGISLFVPRQR